MSTLSAFFFLTRVPLRSVRCSPSLVLSEEDTQMPEPIVILTNWSNHFETKGKSTHEKMKKKSPSLSLQNGETCRKTHFIYF